MGFEIRYYNIKDDMEFFTEFPGFLDTRTVILNQPKRKIILMCDQLFEDKEPARIKSLLF